jgi:hypothetical protein
MTDAVDLCTVNIDTITAPAHLFATAWRNVALATGDDKGPAAFNTAVRIERIEFGGVDWLRLFATDGYSMHWATIPCDIADVEEDPPSIDVEADQVIVAHDYEGRMKALMAWVWGDTKKEPHREITIWTGSMEASDQPTLIPSWTRKGLIIDAGPERLCLPISEHDIIDWRTLVPDGVGDPVDSMLFTTELLTRLAKLKNVSGLVEFRFTGPFAPIRFTATGEPTVDGVVMPVRPGAVL